MDLLTGTYFQNKSENLKVGPGSGPGVGGRQGGMKAGRQAGGVAAAPGMVAKLSAADRLGDVRPPCLLAPGAQTLYGVCVCMCVCACVCVRVCVHAHACDLGVGITTHGESGQAY